jgi:hypothetical protein
MNNKLSPRLVARLGGSRSLSARSRAGRGGRWLALSVVASLALPSVSFALEADATPRWWGSHRDAVQSDWGGHFVAVVGDFNADGLDDVARVHGLGGQTVIDVFAGSGNHFDVSRWDDSGLGGYWPGQQYLAGDVDGDGRDDIIRVFNDGGSVSVDVLIRGAGTSFNYARWATMQGPWVEGAKFLAGDFDGDKRADVAKVASDGAGTVTVDVFATKASYVPSTWASQDFPYWPPDPAMAAAGDFDGDGDADIILGDAFKTKKALLSDKKHFKVEPWAFDVPCADINSCDWAPYGGMATLHAGDLNGDGRLELMYAAADSVQTLSAVNPPVDLENPETPGYVGTWDLNPFIHAVDAPADQVVLGDWDGDGVAEPASLLYTGDGVVAHTYNTEARFDYEAEPIRWARMQGAFAPSQHYLSGDFNGDDLPDVARVFNEAGFTSIDTHLGNQAGFAMKRAITQAGSHWGGMRFLAGDFDGDEIDDVLKVWANNGLTVFDAYYGGPEGFTPVYSAGGGGGHWDAMDYVAGDFDGDGNTDVAKLWNNNGNLIADIFRSNGPGFEPFEYWIGEPVPYYEGAKFTVGDYDGDGKDDIARLFRDPESDQPLYAGAVSFGDAGTKDVVIDYFSVDVLKSSGAGFQNERWVSKSALYSPDSHIVSQDMDGDAADDIVLLAPTPEGKIGMILYVANGSYFTPSILHEDADLGYAQEMMKVVAADFDGDGLGELATIARDRSTDLTNIDVWGGETQLDPTRLGAAGDVWTYSQDDVKQALKSNGDYNLGNKQELGDKDCTIVYPNAAEEVQARDLGLLVCAEDGNGVKKVHTATVYGGCDWSSGVGTCSIGGVTPKVTVFGKELHISGPSVAGCASITQEMVCGEVRSRFTSKSFSVSSSNVYVSGGVYAGPYAGATASLKNSVLSGSVRIDGVTTLKYSLDTSVVLDVGMTGFSMVGDELDKLSPVTDALNEGLGATFGVIEDIGSGFVSGVKKVWKSLGF